MKIKIPNEIILSIRAKYVKKILAGFKTCEYRRKIPPNKVDLIYIYEARGSKKIVGTAPVKKIVSGELDYIWALTKHQGGITEAEFREYFKGCEVAHCYMLDDVSWFLPQADISLQKLGHERPPVNYAYAYKETYD